MQLCSNRGFVPNFIHTPFSMETIHTLLDAGYGVAMLPNSGNLYNKNNIVFRPMEEDDAKIDVVASWKKGNPNPVIQLFLEEL